MLNRAMTDEKPLRPMLPARHQPRLWSIDIGSISLKDTQQQMAYPFFSLSKNPDREERRYEDRRGNTLEVTPSVRGLPTIYDKDFLIYAVSLVMDRLNRGETASRRIVMHAADMLEFANRTKSGRDYKAVENALMRLSGCRIKTNIRTGDIVQTDFFGLIDSGSMVRKYGFDGRLQRVEVTLSEWLWNAIEARQVLTLHPHYFRLRQPLERRIYEIVRKFCGRKAEWRIGIALLHRKSGSRGNLRRFRQAVRKLAGQGDLLDYAVIFDGRRDIAIFRRQEGSLVGQTPSANGQDPVSLPESADDEARRRHGEKIDLAAAEKDWRRWMERKGVRPTNPEAMFLAFLATWVERRQGGSADGAGGRGWLQRIAEEWWAALDEADRGSWRDRIDERVELSDGTGWFRSEASMARAAFEAAWPPDRLPPADRPLPQALLAYAAAEAGLEDLDPAVLQSGWRAEIEERPHMHDRWRASVVNYAGRIAGR